MKWTSVLTLLAAMLGACGDDPEGAPDAALDAGEGPPLERFVAVVQIRGGTEASAAILIEDPADDVMLDLGEGLTIPGRGDAVGTPFEPDVLFTMTSEAPRIERYRVTRAGDFVNEGTLALDAVLLSPPQALTWRSAIFVSPEKAYLFDPFGARMILWNPTTMTVLGDAPLPEDLEIPGPLLFPVIGGNSFVREGELVFTIGFTNSGTDQISETSFIVFADTERDEVTRVLTPDECGYLLHGWETAEGELLYGTDVFSTAFEAATDGDVGGPSCVLRVRGANFTTERVAPPGDLTAGRRAGSFLFVSDTSAFVRVLDEDALPGPASSLTRIELNNNPYWRWGFIADFASREFSEVEGSPLGAGFVTSVTQRGRRFALVSDTDFMGSRVVELFPDGTLRPGLRTTQALRNVVALTL